MGVTRASAQPFVMGVFVLALACGRSPGDAPSQAGTPDDPCADGPTLEVVELPASYVVRLGDQVLGTLEIPDEAAPRLVAAADAPAASVAGFAALLDAATGQPSVEFGWSKETRGGETYGCTRAVAKGDPGYVAALARQLAGQRIEGGIVELRRE